MVGPGGSLYGGGVWLCLGGSHKVVKSVGGITLWEGMVGSQGSSYRHRDL